VSPNLVRVAPGADLLIHEARSDVETKALVHALSRRSDAHVASVMAETENYHTTPEEAAREANEAGVRVAS
jgi:ribonuclease Z